MRFAFLWAGVLLGSATLFGCSASETGESDPLQQVPIDEDPPVNGTLVFEGLSALELAPGEVRPVTVVASPAREIELYFALLNAPSDASLDAARVFTGEDGRATVSIHAPSTPASFTLRAWVKKGPSVELSVAVSKQGVGMIEIVPDYNGKRTITEWVGSVVAGTTCAAIASKLPGEPSGSFVATSPAQENPLVQSVPVGPKLAVHVRAGHFAWGCTDAHDITAGKATKVKVHVVDVPPALERTDLDLTLSYTPEPNAYGKLLDVARDGFLNAMFPPDKTEAAVVLDAMTDLAYEPESLALARVDGGWDALAEAHFALLQTPLADRMSGWIDLGLAGAPQEIRGRLAAIEGVPGKALFRAERIGGLDAAEAGAPPVHLFSWTSAPDDAVFLSGQLFWIPSRLVGAACRAGADVELGALETITDTLAKAAGCSDLAASLGGTEACDQACLTELCRWALWTRWESAVDASASQGTVGTIQVGASGVVKVNDVATPVAMAGSWLGNVSDGSVSAQVSGPVGGILAEDPVPEEPEEPEDDPPPQ